MAKSFGSLYYDTQRLRNDNTPGSHIEAWQVLEILDDLLETLVELEERGKIKT